MHINLLELHILLDALTGSLSFSDGGDFFKFPNETRSAVRENILRRMDGPVVEVVESETSAPAAP